MKTIIIERLSSDNFGSESLDFYDRKQVVNKVYRKAGEEYVLTECQYTEEILR